MEGNRCIYPQRYIWFQIFKRMFLVSIERYSLLPKEHLDIKEPHPTPKLGLEQGFIFPRE